MNQSSGPSLKVEEDEDTSPPTVRHHHHRRHSSSHRKSDHGNRHSGHHHDHRNSSHSHGHAKSYHHHRKSEALSQSAPPRHHHHHHKAKAKNDATNTIQPMASTSMCLDQLELSDGIDVFDCSPSHSTAIRSSQRTERLNSDDASVDDLINYHEDTVYLYATPVDDSLHYDDSVVVPVHASMIDEEPTAVGGSHTKSDSRCSGYPYANATPIDDNFDDTPAMDEESPPIAVAQETEPKRGTICCYCCCDYRRAVVYVNAAIIVLQTIFIILVLTGAFTAYLYPDIDERSSLNRKYQTIEIVLCSITIFLSGSAVIAAFKYNICFVGLNALWLLMTFILDIVLATMYCDEYCGNYRYGCTCTPNILAIGVSGIVTLLWIYPHVEFIQEVRQGIMSEETFAREGYCCLP